MSIFMFSEEAANRFAMEHIYASHSQLDEQDDGNADERVTDDDNPSSSCKETLRGHFHCAFANKG
jgi:hypothetical protein